MPRIAGNQFYYEQIQHIADKFELSAKEAEFHLLYNTISKMRWNQHMTYPQIAAYFKESYDLGREAFYTRLRKLRASIHQGGYGKALP